MQEKRDENNDRKGLSEREIIVKALKDAAWVSSLGIYIGLCIVFGLLIGKWIDGNFGTEPVFTVIFILCGFAAAIRGGYRDVKRLIAKYGEVDEEGGSNDESGGRPISRG